MSVTCKSSGSSYQFGNETLTIRKKTSEMRIRGWDAPSATRCSLATKKWESFFPEFQLVRPFRKESSSSGLSEKEQAAGQMTFDFFRESIVGTASTKERDLGDERRHAFEQFRSALPAQVAATLEPFRVRQWRLLEMMYHDRGSVDLAESNPALAFFLAQKLDGNVDQIEQLQYSSKRRRDILEFLGYPGTNAAVNVISKIRLPSITTDNWRMIVDMLGTELAKEKTPLGHLSRINLGVMEIVVDPIAAAAAGANLLEDVATDGREKTRGRVVHMIRSALEMQDDLQVGKKVSFFPDLKRLYDVHERVTGQYKRRVKQLNDAELAAMSGSFTEPPIPGVPGVIEPLTCPRDLVDEGETQGNCVASYARKLMTGKVFVYRVIGPERSTLSIVKKQKGWEIGELEARYNVAASKETEAVVNEWLRQNQARAI